MKIKEFDRVSLKDGRMGTIIEVLGDGVAFDVDVSPDPEDVLMAYSIPIEEIATVQ